MMEERWALAAERLAEIAAAPDTAEDVAPYFAEYAAFLTRCLEECRFLAEAEQNAPGEEAWAAHNRALYAGVLQDDYEESFANPAYCVSLWGEAMGRLLACLAFELRSVVPLVYEADRERILRRVELFLEMHTAFAVAARDGQTPEPRHLQRKLYRYVYDYLPEELQAGVEESLAGRLGRAREVLLAEPDAASIYRYGEYITPNEKETARFLATLSAEEIDHIAESMVGGFRRGFVLTGKDLSKKKYVALYYHVGFERIARRTLEKLEEGGLTVMVPRAVHTLFRLFSRQTTGLIGGGPAPQYLYDHREDLALVWDEELMERYLEALRGAYRACRADTVLFAGPEVMETFGEEPFSPVSKKENLTYDETQRGRLAHCRSRASNLYNKAVIGEERSYSVVAFPLPEISETHYEEIFREVVRINTLDYAFYTRVQSILIDALDRATTLHFVGRGNNRTDLVVRLQDLTDPASQTKFENCVADVNIPVGEVFTTPSLEGTNGVLHVSEVYLEGLHYKDLSLTFTEGRVSEYACANFEDPALGRAYIEKNVLFHHQQLPMGECAIGTNTTAYVAARRFGIEKKLPILIAEKTGPHFAVGDTCYSYEEEVRTYNPDGKEIIPKDNTCSLLRATDPSAAYFGCHTDITIPYDELGAIDAVTEAGEIIPILREGRFVLPGTEPLNLPLDEWAGDGTE